MTSLVGRGGAAGGLPLDQILVRKFVCIRAQFRKGRDRRRESENPNFAGVLHKL